MTKFSKLGLGTVQFGTDYGVSNKMGITSQNEASSILALAKNLGIDLIDTSPAYGAAESVLGAVLGDVNLDVVTKTVRIDSKIISKAHIENVKQSFYKSLRDMRKDSIYGLIAHQGYDLYKQGYEHYIEFFDELKEASLVKKIGASVYNKMELENVLSCCDIDMVQLPLSILDQDLLVSGYLDELQRRGIEVHVRSVFLQGLVFLNKNSLDPYFDPISSTLARFDDVLTECNISALDASLSYVMNAKSVNKVVLGIQNVEQLMQVANSISKNIKLPPVGHLSLSNTEFVNPSKWRLKNIS